MPNRIASQRQRYPNKEGITHTSYALYYHLVWDVAHKEQAIDVYLYEFLSDFIKQKCEELDVHLLALGINPDHIHVVLSLKPAHYIPDLVQALKGGSSHAANHKPDGPANLYWKRGYSIRTISERNLAIAKVYVHNQAQHHGHTLGRPASQIKEDQASYEF
jgi:REP element-mobilizing transposase RayT